MNDNRWIARRRQSAKQPRQSLWSYCGERFLFGFLLAVIVGGLFMLLSGGNG